jgi:hypothetical protein
VSWAETLSSSPWWKPWHQSGSSLTETIVIILSKGKWGITLWVLFELYLLKQNPQHLPEQATPPLLQDTLLWNSICPKKENRKKLSSVYIQIRSGTLHFMVSGQSNAIHSLSWNQNESHSESAVKQLHHNRNPVIEIHECTHTFFPDLDFPSHFSI